MDDADAIQVFVRGFYSEEKGDVMVERLEGMGFEIKMKSIQDTMGGIIETHITPADEVPSLEEIRAKIYEGQGQDEIQLFLQARTYQVIDDVS